RLRDTQRHRRALADARRAHRDRGALASRHSERELGRWPDRRRHQARPPGVGELMSSTNDERMARIREIQGLMNTGQHAESDEQWTPPPPPSLQPKKRSGLRRGVLGVGGALVVAVAVTVAVTGFAS